jgi:hypothetical protein
LPDGLEHGQLRDLGSALQQLSENKTDKQNNGGRMMKKKRIPISHHSAPIVLPNLVKLTLLAGGNKIDPDSN